MTLLVSAAGPACTVQDLGRVGWAHLGVPRAGALDAPAAALANRLVGNEAGAAVLEVTWGGLTLEADSGHWVAVTGAPAPVLVDGRDVFGRVAWLSAGTRLSIGTPTSGVRSYLAVGGGIDVAPVLGSRSTDLLCGVGPAPVTAGDVLPVGTPPGEPQPHDTPRPPAAGPLRLTPGPRADWCADPVAALVGGDFVVRPESNRVALRLAGPSLEWTRQGELPSEGLVPGAVQVPPDGQPLVFLADHPTTGGYPVVAVVAEGDLWQCAQLRPGDPVRFSRPRAPGAARA